MNAHMSRVQNHVMGFFFKMFILKCKEKIQYIIFKKNLMLDISNNNLVITLGSSSNISHHV
jgi:hypothetical protein